MSFDDDLNAIRSASNADSGKLGELASLALTEQREDDVLPLLAAATRTSPDARLWQWKGLLERALDEHADALKSLAEAARLAPSDPSIAHGYARVALEAGVPAVDLFKRALQLDRTNTQVYIGLNAARIAEGRAEEAEADLERVLEQSPLFVDGHHQLAQLKSLIGRRAEAFDSIERAIASDPHERRLWWALFEFEMLAEDFSRLRQSLDRAASVAPEHPFKIYEFIAATELGQIELADSLSHENAVPPVWLVRHFLRSGRIQQAAALVDAELGDAEAADILPYAETVWRLSGDDRLDWLSGDPNLIAVIDLSEELASIGGLADRLRALHEVSGRYLNQSVRGGSQTDGPLFSRIEPEIRALRNVIVGAIEKYSARLARLPDKHPQKKPIGRRVRFTGSWSVRLTGGGFHRAHIHPRGWISSALYLSLPDQLAEGEGWLSLGGAPPELGLDIAPARLIEPKLGQLVLFPSWMWHGTQPFPQGERLTVAFDVAPPA